MALALYRKYRPSTLADVVGQTHVTGPLHTALAAARTGNAYLFSGPTGCGKTVIARIMARSLNCDQGPTPEPCGACPSCLALVPGGPGTLDVADLDASWQGGYDDIRELRDLAALPPVASRFRILIIDQAHMLSPMAVNALLGTVDEPQDRTVFIFTTDKPDRLPTALRSRMLHYQLRLLAPTVLSVLLENVCQHEGVTVEPGVLPLVVRAGGGSARQALTVLEQLLAGAGPEGITHCNAVALVGDTDPILLDELIDAFEIGDAGSMFGALDRALRVNDDAWILATNLLRRLRDLVILASVPDAVTHELIDVAPGQLERMTAQAALLGAAPAIRLAEAIADALAGMQGNIAHRLVLELCCARALLTCPL